MCLVDLEKAFDSVTGCPRQKLNKTSIEDVSVLCGDEPGLPVMQREEGFWFQSPLLQCLSETDRGLQVVLHGGETRTQSPPHGEGEGPPVYGYRLFGLKVLMNLNSLLWIHMLSLHHIPENPTTIDRSPA
ncbi:hypothetical protein CCH79_00017829, partial [Gambusia affinis]